MVHSAIQQQLPPFRHPSAASTSFSSHSFLKPAPSPPLSRHSKTASAARREILVNIILSSKGAKFHLPTLFSVSPGLCISWATTLSSMLCLTWPAQVYFLFLIVIRISSALFVPQSTSILTVYERQTTFAVWTASAKGFLLPHIAFTSAPASYVPIAVVTFTSAFTFANCQRNKSY